MNLRAYTYEGLAFEESDFLPPPKNRWWQVVSDMLEQLQKHYEEALMLRQQRAEFSRMSDRILKDIGVSRYDLEREYKRFMI